MKKILAAALFILLASCSQDEGKNSSSTDANSAAAHATDPEKQKQFTYDTIASLSDIQSTDTAVVVHDSAGTHHIVKILPEDKAAPRTRRMKASAAKSSFDCDDGSFGGNDRREVKTSYFSGKKITKDNVAELLKVLPTEDFMRNNHQPPISRDGDSPRAAEEKSVAVIKEAWIIVFKRVHDDNDYHVIVSSDPDYKKGTLMNIEIAGLPDASSPAYDKLKKVRDDFENKVIKGRYCSESWAMYASNPIKVSFSGNIFYDIDHAPGVVGPEGYRPQVSWEVHPVLSIKRVK